MHIYILLKFHIFANAYQQNSKSDKTFFCSFRHFTNMIAINFVIFCLSYIVVIITFIISLWLSQYFNSPRLFHLIAIISSVSVMYIPIALELQSPSVILDRQLAFFIGGLSILLTLKFLELALSYKWTYIRQMPLKLAVVYILALPRMPESEEKLSELSRQNVRREGISSILRGICQLIVLRTLFYLIPPEWLTISSSLFSPIFRFLRYGLYSLILYLLVDVITSIGFGIYSIIFNLRMRSVFPAFPFASTSLREFWSYRWNKLVQSSLHIISFVAIPTLIEPIIPMNKTTKGLFAFTLSGFVHEYVFWFIRGTWSGKYMIFFILHGLLVLLEIMIKLPVKPHTLQGKIMGWMWTVGVTLITLPLFFDPLTEADIVSIVQENV